MMGSLSRFRYAWPAPPDSFDEEKHVPMDTLTVPTIVITPPPSPNIGVGHHTHSYETSWPISEPNPFYLQPPPYLRPLHHGCLRQSRHRPLMRGHHGWWTLTLVLILLITSSSLHGMYSINSSGRVARARDKSANEAARQEAVEGPDGGDSTFILPLRAATIPLLLA